jgi:protocatechuate 3,4-dioxygenase beta subunit
VLVGSPWSVPRSLNGPHEPQRFAPAGRETFTDGDGQYAVDGVEPGREGVQAWAAGHAPAHAVIEIRTAVTVCDLTLQAGASVHGQVRDAAGQPVREASVGPVFADGGFVVASSQTDAEGRYRLVDLYPGQQDLAASAATGRATTIVELTAGATAEWNPVLQRVTGIRGRVLGPDDRPLGGITVSLGDDGGLPVGDRTTTDGSGAFALQPADEGPVCVRVGDWLQPPLKIARWIQPGTQDLVIRLAAADLPTARLRGRIVDANGAPLVATFTANRDRETAAHVAEAAADGRFELGPLPAGRYRGRVVTKAHGSLPVADVLLEPDGQRDLGDLVLQLPGSAVVDVRDEQGQPARSLVRLYTPDGDWVASMQTEQGRAVFAALQPGRYFVCCGGVPRAAHGEFEVLSAARAQADLQLAPVGCADVTVRDPSAVPDLDLAVAAFADGRFAGLFGNMRSGPRVRLWVPPGRYAVEVRAHDGRRARAEVTIRAVDDHPTVAVDLPPK